MKKNNVLTIVIVFVLSFMGISACNNSEKEAEKQAQAQLGSLKAQLAQLNEKVPQLKRLSEQIAQTPENAELYYVRGQLLSQMNEPELAVADLTYAIRRDSSQANYYIAAANLYFSGNHGDRAIELLEQAKAKKLSEATVMTQLGQYYFYMQQYDKATENLLEALKINNNNSQANFWLGMVYRDQKNNDQAIEVLEKSVAQNPNSYNAQMILAQTYGAEKNRKAVEHYDKAILLDTTKVEANYGKAMFYQSMGEYDNAMAEYKRLLLRDAQYTNAFYNIGHIYFYEKKQYDKAYTNFDIAVKTSPANANAYFMRGLCAEKLGKKEDARRDYDSALTFNPDLKEAQIALDALQKKDS